MKVNMIPIKDRKEQETSVTWFIGVSIYILFAAYIVAKAYNII